MKVYKFGGASVKDAASVINVSKIVLETPEEPLIIVASAMGKMTNALEELVAAVFEKRSLEVEAKYRVVETFHLNLLSEIYPELYNVSSAVQHLLKELKNAIKVDYPDYGRAYDSIVPFGELLSTTVISEYLNTQNRASTWLDTRQLVVTNSHHRRATVNWEVTEERIREAIRGDQVYLVQGFIGADSQGHTTTLGREGSDYTASVFAFCTDAEDVTIWKDVPAVLNGDPKVFPNCIPLKTISYREAIELAYYGASVIHPKTIQPLQRKEIPLRVCSFIDRSAPGTLITRGAGLDPLVPCFIQKTKQVLITLSTHDLAFIVEDHLSFIYQAFHDLGVSVNLMQNTAISSSFCINHDAIMFPKLLKTLEKSFDVRFNDNLTIYTIRHYNPLVINGLKEGKEVLVEQISRNTFQMVCKA